MGKAIFVLLIVSICFPESPKNNTFTRYNSLKTTIDSICSNILNSHDCARAVEQHQIPLFKEEVIRKNSLLNLEDEQ